MTPGDPLARRAQYLLPADLAIGRERGLHMSFERIGNASLPIAGPAAASTDVTLAAARPRARMGGQSGGPFLEIRDVAFALLDIFTVVFGLAFLALYVGAVAFSIFVLLVLVQ